MKSRKLNCRGFLSEKALCCGESHVAHPARMKRPGRNTHFGRRLYCDGFTYRFGTPFIRRNWKPLDDAGALARKRQELEAMRILDETGIAWGI